MVEIYLTLRLISFTVCKVDFVVSVCLSSGVAVAGRASA